ncbi:unnamed protein product, partial [marine sediment metagenome]
MGCPIITREGQELKFQTGIAFAFGATHTYTLSKAEAVKAIIINAKMGAITGGATGTIVVNTAVQAIRIRINGRLAIAFDGLKNIAGQMSMGIATLREFYKQIHVVPMPDDSFMIEFPTAIPKNNEIQIIIELASTIASIQTSGGDRDALASSTFDITYRTGRVSKRTVIPFISYTLFSHADRVGFLDEFIPPTTLPLRKLMMITYDGSTIADATYDSLVISEGANLLHDGS